MATGRRKTTKRRRNGTRKKTLKGAWRAIPGWAKLVAGGAAVLAVVGVGKKQMKEGE